MRDQIIGAVIALLIVSLGGMPSPAHAQEPTCIPYDIKVKALQDMGAIVLPDVEVSGFAVDRLMLVIHNGNGLVMPIYNGCVLTEGIPLGSVTIVPEKPPPRLPPNEQT